MEDIDTIIGLLAISILIPILLILIAIIIIYIIGIIKLYRKAGKNGWEAIIPFYNKWILVEIAEMNWWWFLLLIAPSIASILNKNLTPLAALATLFGKFCCFYNISKKLHKDSTLAILSTVFPLIMIPIIGLSKDYQFDKSVPVSENGPFQTTNQTSTTSKPKSDEKYCQHCGKEIKKGAKYCIYCGKKLE